MRASLGTLSVASIAVVLVACGGAFSTPLSGAGDAGSGDATTGSSTSGGSGGGSGSGSSGGGSGGSSSGSGTGGSSSSSSGAGGTSSGSGGGSSGSSGAASGTSSGGSSTSSGSTSGSSSSGGGSSGSTSGSSSGGNSSSSGGNSSSSGGSSGSSSGGDDAGAPCTSNAQCDPGFLCGYPEADGCSAKGRCVMETGALCNTVLLGCSCNGTDFNTVCVGLPDGYVSEPLAHTGVCTIGIDAGIECDADSQCGRGLKCCYPCGAPGCVDQCIKPMSSGMCPLFP